MLSARAFNAAIHVGGIIFFFRTARSGRRPRSVIGIVEPATLGIQQVRRFVDGEKSVPFRSGITAINRLCEIEAGVAARNKISVKVRDVAIGVGENCVIRRICSKLHRLPK